MREPWITRLSTSRPKRSVPKSACGPGRASIRSKFWSSGLRGAREPANTAITTMRATQSAPPRTTALWVTRRSWRLHRRRCGATVVEPSTPSVLTSTGGTLGAGPPPVKRGASRLRADRDGLHISRGPHFPLMSHWYGRDMERSDVARHQAWAVVLAGGEGVRLRSFVRRAFGDERPKQVCRLLGSRSLLRQALDRVALVVPPERTVVVGVEQHARYLAAELGGRPGPKLLKQPQSRGTAAA